MIQAPMTVWRENQDCSNSSVQRKNIFVVGLLEMGAGLR